MVNSARGLPSASASIMTAWSMVIGVFGEDTAPSLPIERGTSKNRSTTSMLAALVEEFKLMS